MWRCFSNVLRGALPVYCRNFRHYISLGTFIVFQQRNGAFITKVSVFDLQSRLPILRGQKRKKKLCSSISLPGLDEDVFLANVTVRIVLPKQMAP